MARIANVEFDEAAQRDALATMRRRAGNNGTVLVLGERVAAVSDPAAGDEVLPLSHPLLHFSRLAGRNRT